MNPFTSQVSGTYVGGVWTDQGYFIRQYLGTGTASVVEGRPDPGFLWPTKTEAEAACERVMAGDESGIKFAMYADD